MRSWWGGGAGFRILLVVAVSIHPDVVDTRPDVVAAVVGVAFSGSLFGSHLYDNSPWHWGPLCCRIPFAENVGYFASDNLPAVDIVATAGGFAAVPAIAVSVPLIVSSIDLGGQRWPADITVMVTLHYLLRLHV